MTLLSLLGWFGTLCYLYAHARISVLGKSADPVYFGFNATAALALVISSLALMSWQPVAINLFWLMVSIASLQCWQLPKLPISNRVLFASCLLMLLIGCGMLLQGSMSGIAVWGWSSTLAFCLGYWKFSAGRLQAKHYYLLNTYAAWILLFQLYQDGNWPVFGLEVVWGFISLTAFLSTKSNDKPQ
ncbi:hypothetical protein IC617_11565 [Neiella sp. HB171785]|uniref:CBU-0592-like domain-containing protein n=1 Tax=Neiella litorisoli TaxID=2771431 RepID=A0A8J6QJB6_9GAMM|nr:hypothetical protein [Neiella litorisoli]MBD1390068.1 hypothetical protein [Neiella litorisoli]